MRVKVTWEHILEGARSSCMYCPIAQALVDTPLGHTWVSGAAVEWQPWQGGDDIVTPLPPAAAQFTLAFDRGFPVLPFEFELPIPTSPLGAAQAV